MKLNIYAYSWKNTVIDERECKSFDDIKTVILNDHEDPSYIYLKDGEIHTPTGYKYELRDINNSRLAFTNDFVDDVAHSKLKHIQLNMTNGNNDMTVICKTKEDIRNHILNNNQDNTIFRYLNDKTISNGDYQYTILSENTTFNNDDIDILNVNLARKRFVDMDVTLIEYDYGKQYFDIRPHSETTKASIENMTKTWNGPVTSTMLLKDGELTKLAYLIPEGLSQIPSKSGKPLYHDVNTSIIDHYTENYRLYEIKNINTTNEQRKVHLLRNDSMLEKFLLQNTSNVHIHSHNEISSDSSTYKLYDTHGRRRSFPELTLDALDIKYDDRYNQKHDDKKHNIFQKAILKLQKINEKDNNLNK